MPRILVIYGTTDGHTAKVAAFVGEHLRALGHEVEVDDSKEPRRHPMAPDFDGVIVAASIHARGYQQSVRRWIRDNLEALKGRPNAFLSVCMGIVQGTPRVRADLDAIVARFVEHTGWQPDRVEFVAGAIPYSRYGLFKRVVMMYMSRQAGVKTSPKQDYEYTDWEALKRFAVTFAEAIPATR